MRSNHNRLPRPGDLRRSIERLDALPIRPETARCALERAEGGDEAKPNAAPGARGVPLADLDPGWVLARVANGGIEELALVRDLPWWPRATAGEPLQRLWRHSVAGSLAARRLAHESGEADPAKVGRAALLAHLGLWAWGVLEPAVFADWMNQPDPDARLALERSRLGRTHVDLGLRLAERWGCDETTADAVWLRGVAGRSLHDSPELRLLAAAGEAADRTPWALHPKPNADSGPVDPRIRLLIAEVQARCSSPFVDPEATEREERLTRDNARLRLDLEKAKRDAKSRASFIDAFADSRFGEEPESWAERAGLAWCDEPGVSAARVVWRGEESSASVESPRRPTVVVPLGSPSRTVAEVHLWSDGDDAPPTVEDHPARAAWNAWAVEVEARRRMLRRLEALNAAIRLRPEGEPASRVANLDALAEFAAGAGHELNNPLAVILGRAQLLLAKQTDPEAVRSLRAIITQAQRTNRILRDLMYIARTPEPRVKLCQPDEIVKTSVRDLQNEADVRGVRISAELRSDAAKVWADPDALRQVADALLRNALEATPNGGQVVISANGTSAQLDWTVTDNGRGLSPQEAIHLYDPFFCGRQAGRGLGLGLPRVARIVERTGGRMRWSSTQGRGTSFQVLIPLSEAPRPPVETEAQARTA